MNAKEIFKKAVKLEPTNRVPVIILSGGVWAYNQNGMSLQDSFDMSPEASADYLINTNKKVKSDLIWCAGGCNHLVLRALGAKTKFNKVGTAASVKPFITSPSDIDKLNLDDIKKDPGIIAMVESTKIMKQKVGDEVMLAVSQWGPMTLANLMLGTTEFMLGLRKDPEGMKYVMDFTKEMVLTYWNLFLDAGVEHVSQAEPVASGDMISRKMFEKIALPLLLDVNERIGDKPFSKMIHICGNTSQILEVLPDTKADMFSMDYKVDLALAREKLDGKMAFAGQIDPAEIMLMSSKERVAEASQKCIDDSVWQRGGFILMPGCDLAPETPLENLESMVKVAHSNTQDLQVAANF